MNKKGQVEMFMEAHPLAYVGGAIGAFIGFYSVRVMGGQGFSVGEAGYHIGIIWKILIPVCSGIACFFIVNKMFSE
jgi:hypothetical protein